MATSTTQTIENVFFYYTKIAEPTFKYGSTTEKEYSVTVFMSKADKVAFNKLKLNKTIKEIDNAEFEAKFKTDVPFPGQDEQYSISVTQNVTKKDGSPLADFLRPKTYLRKDGKVSEITDVLIGNGSQGTLRYTVRDSPIEGGKPSIKLSALLVTDLVEYVRKDSDEWAAAAEEEAPF